MTNTGFTAGAAFAAGAAAIDIHHIGADYYARMGIALDAPQWREQLRCLVFRHNDSLTVIFQADWGAWFKLLEETRQIVQDMATGRRVEVLCFGTMASHDIDFFAVH